MTFDESASMQSMTTKNQRFVLRFSPFICNHQHYYDLHWLFQFRADSCKFKAIKGVHFNIWIYVYLLRLLFNAVEVEALLCQFLFLWLINQLLICFNCKPVSCTNLALSSSCKAWQGLRWANQKNWWVNSEAAGNVIFENIICKSLGVAWIQNHMH